MPKQQTNKANKTNPGKVSNIKQINDIRKELGKGKLPLRNNKWYDHVESFALQRYSNPELAIKMISADITPYRANQLNKTNLTGAKNMLSRITLQRHGLYSLDDAIRNNSFEMFESDQFEQFNVTQEHLLNEGEMDLLRARTKMVESKLVGIRKK